MKISSKTHYGVQICFRLAQKNGETVSVKEFEKLTAVSDKYIEKVMRILSNTGIVKSTRGANGGYTLARPASQIKMGEVVRALEENNLEFIGCVSKKGCCCPSSRIWQKLYKGMNEILDGITLQDMVDDNLSEEKKCNKICEAK